MRQIQVLTEEYKDNLDVLNWKNANIVFVEDWRNVDKTIPVMCASNLLRDYVRHWLNTQQPAIYVGRGYAGNHMHKRRWFHRASVNGWANTKLMPVPYSRWPLMNIPKHPWKVFKVKNILIAPSLRTTRAWTLENPDQWTDRISKYFTGANIKFRPKVKKQSNRYETLWDDFEWADLVISQSSAITVEAFWYGKKVISTEPCITWAAEKSTFEDWENPKEPELRDAWHEHLAWSQFTTEEWHSGEAIELIEKYLGPINNYSSDYNYNLFDPSK